MKGNNKQCRFDFTSAVTLAALEMLAGKNIMDIPHIYRGVVFIVFGAVTMHSHF